jgi:signal transduction histidine kinase
LNNEFSIRNNASVNVTDAQGNSLEERLRENQTWYTVSYAGEDGQENKGALSEYDMYVYLNGDVPEVGSCYYALSMNLEARYYRFLGIMDEDAYKHVQVIEMQSDNDAETEIPSAFERINVLSVSEASAQERELYLASGWNQNLVSDYSGTILISAMLAETALISTSGFGMEAGIMVYDDIALLTIEKTAESRAGEPLTYRLVASLQPVDEASAAITSYYPWFFLTAVAAALIVSFVYTRYVSRPITDISLAANRMAGGKLDTRLDVRHTNEIGVLSESLNHLASSLQNSMTELKDANQRLLDDIAEKEAQEQARRDFTANASHELKTPLGVMRCYVDLIRDGADAEQRKEYCDTVLSEIGRMNKMILQMLQLAKAESGVFELNKTRFRMRDLIEDSVTMFRPQLEERGILVQIRGDFSEVCADVSNLEQVVTNLMSNAANYALPGTTIDIAGRQDNGIHRVGITNACRSMTQKDADQLFKRFYTLDKARNENGTGLGLAICAAILESHGFAYGVVSHGDSVGFWFEYGVS